MDCRRLMLALLTVTVLAVGCDDPEQGATPEGSGAAVAVQPAPARVAQSPGEGATREVILATRRDHALHLFDAATLEPLGHIRVHNLAHQVSARADGRMLFIAQAASVEGGGCCALFAIDLVTREMCRLIEPALNGTPSVDGRLLFTQRGNTGIDVFDAHTLAPLPSIAAPGVYRLYPSPDGRWLFGITHFGGPSLDVVDVERGVLLRRLPVSLSGESDGQPPFLTGAWLDGRFYLYAHNGRAAYLYPVTAEIAALPLPLPVHGELPGPPEELPSVAPALLAGGGRLLLHEQLGRWFKLDARGARRGVVHGGVFVLDADGARVLAHLAPSVDIAWSTGGAEGRRLYGLDAGAGDGSRPVRLLVMDTESGAVLAERALPEDVWSIAVAAIPEALLPRGEMQPVTCRRPER